MRVRGSHEMQRYRLPFARRWGDKEMDEFKHRYEYHQLAKEWVSDAQREVWEAEQRLLLYPYTEHRHELYLHVLSFRKVLSDRLLVLKNAKTDLDTLT